MQTNFNQHLKPEKIEEYFRLILSLHGEEMVREVFDYILVVKGKYLQMMTVYYIFKKDISRVQCNFERFNEHYFELKERLDNVIADQSLNKVDNEKLVTAEKPLSIKGPGELFKFNLDLSHSTQLKTQPLPSISTSLLTPI